MTHRTRPEAGGTAGAIRRGALAGLAAALVLALWFLVIDTLAGRPFHTPAFLARVLLGFGSGSLGAAGIAAYTAAHFGVFLLLGAGVSWLMERLRIVPDLLLGFVLGFLLFDLVFYGGVRLTGTDVVNDLGWVAVLVGNILAGLTLVGIVRLLHPEPGVSWVAGLLEHRILREGLSVGMLGAVVVAVWFLILDGIMGRLLFTPAALGSVVFHGVTDAAGVRVEVLPVLGYTVLHLAAFAIVGVVAAAIVGYAEERHPYVLLGAVLLFVTFETFFIGLVALLAQWLLALIPWWSIVAANLLAAGAMAAYLWRRHPALARAASDPELERDVEAPVGARVTPPT